MPANLPGELPPPTGAMPSSLPPIPAKRPQTPIYSVELEWNKLKSIQPTLAELILFIDKHPELVEWAKVARVSLAPGAKP